MYHLYAFATPNSVKAVIMLEELAQDYRLRPINVKQGDQKSDTFLALNPNGKVPVLVETGAEGNKPLVLTESSAILVYLAEKHGRLLPHGGAERARVFEQLFFHASALSPSFGQAGFFKRLASEPQPLAELRFSTEAERVTGLIDRVLHERRFAAGDIYSIADIAHFGWFWRREFAGVTLDGYPNVARWYDQMSQRPAVRRAITRLNALVPQA